MTLLHPSDASTTTTSVKTHDELYVTGTVAREGKTKDTSITEPRSFVFHLYTAFLFVCNDFKVIVIPQTAVGCVQALASGLIITSSAPTLSELVVRIPTVAFWNTFTTFTFNVANQRLPDSIVEDSLNKSWRPIPSGRLSPQEAHRLLFIMIPMGFTVGILLRSFLPTVALLLLTWMYNDLRGGDHWLLRNAINAVAFGIHGSGATIIAATGGIWGGAGHLEFTPTGIWWTVLLSLVVLTTLQVQDLPDMEGDAARDRSTIPLVFGEHAGRWSVAVLVAFWSLACPLFWCFVSPWPYTVLACLGLSITFRTLTFNDVASDERTYKLWCVWLTSLYTLPIWQIR